MKKKPKKITILVVGILLVINMGQFLYNHQLYANEQNLLMLYTQEMIPHIVCIGDSLTNGTGGDGVSYPSHLQDILWENSIYVPTINLGVGGENTVTIAGRMGAIPYKVKDFVIKEDCTPVQIEFISEENKLICPLRQGEAGINPCEIAGVTGTLSIEQENYMAAEYTYYFTRNEVGKSVHVTNGTELHTRAAESYKDGIFVIFMGENHGFNDIDDLIAQQKEILSLQEKHNDKYLILGMTSGTKKERQEMESAMENTYGARYINLREYLSTQGPYDAKVTLNEDDLKKMEQGKIPDCLLSDHVHFNAKGYQLIAEVIYDRMVELGYFDSVMGAVELYGGH